MGLPLAEMLGAPFFYDEGSVRREFEPGADTDADAGLLAEREVSSILRSRTKSPFTEDPTEHDLFPIHEHRLLVRRAPANQYPLVERSKKAEHTNGAA